MNFKQVIKPTSAVMGVALLTLVTGCSANLSIEEAESVLRDAHLGCEVQVLKSEKVEPELSTYDDKPLVTLSYWIPDGESKAIVECVSKELFGEDLTTRGFTREEWIDLENRFDMNAANYEEGYFDSRALVNWNKPFDFSIGAYFGTTFTFLWDTRDFG